MHSPFKITIKLGSPICLTFPFLHLDGIVAYLDAIDKFGQKLFEFSRMEYLPELERPLPFKKTGMVYNASAAIFLPEAEMRFIRIYKRFEDKYSDVLKKKKLRIGSGFFRSFAIAEPYIPATHVIFYGNGNVKRIKYLFENYLIGIGNDIRIGFGAIRDIIIENINNDYSLIKNGMAMRTIPIKMLKDYEDTAYITYKQPYWYKTNATLCVAPGMRCELNEKYI
ncbi:hypothetical protein [Marinitoga sp. 1138]|uniref:hypothetical protein n=1 Tax=Marinitoga sp. 1138 TaxID=1643334 RepID=UPI001586DDAA|nr:hypothetical protein [Marinitoga sp. 1138]NUU96747.1 hypothetical protein [Marinitoga sp. 1138]